MVIYFEAIKTVTFDAAEFLGILDEASTAEEAKMQI